MWPPLCCSIPHQIVILHLYLVISILCLCDTFPDVNTDVTLKAEPNVSQIKWLIREWKWLKGQVLGSMAWWLSLSSLSFAMTSSQTTTIVHLNCFLLSISSGATVGSVSTCKGPLGYNCVTSGLCWHELRFLSSSILWWLWQWQWWTIVYDSDDNDGDESSFMIVMPIMVMDHGLWWLHQLWWWTLIYDNDVNGGDRHGLWWLQQLWWWWCRWWW